MEIDPAVVAVARQYFNYVDSAQSSVHVVDARVFIKRVGIRGAKYDLVILDAFTGDYIPEHLMTVEFVAEAASLLSERGVLVANTFSTSTLYDHESVTYNTVFPEFINFKMPNTGNRVIIASNNELPTPKIMHDRARQLDPRLNSYGVDIRGFLPFLGRDKDWKEDIRSLTGQPPPSQSVTWSLAMIEHINKVLDIMEQDTQDELVSAIDDVQDAYLEIIKHALSLLMQSDTVRCKEYLTEHRQLLEPCKA